MNEIFLKAKHWQLFLVFFGIPMVFHFSYLIYFMFNFQQTLGKQKPSPEIFFDLFSSYSWFMPIALLFSLVPPMLWMWSVGSKLYELLSDDLKFNLKRFKRAMILVVVSHLGLLALMSSIMQPHEMFLSNGIPEEEIAAFVLKMLVSVFFIMIFSVAGFLGQVYLIATLGKALKTHELNKEIKAGDCIAEMFLFWFSPIGVWILQPRINSLCEHESQKEIE